MNPNSVFSIQKTAFTANQKSSLRVDLKKIQRKTNHGFR